MEQRGLLRDAGSVFGDPAPRPASWRTWHAALASPRGAFARQLRACYGDDGGLLARRTGLWRCALERFRLGFGADEDVFLVGVPSRVNWEGHHVDHQGGYYNATTDEREAVAVVRARADREVRIENVAAARFPPRRFSLDTGAAGGKADWASYVRGALQAVERRWAGEELHGMDMAIASDVPIGVGLSSSHALVLVAALAAAAVNGRRLDKREAVVAVQDGEWFVGSRTGLGDQATMIFGRRACLFSSPVVDPAEIDPRYVTLPEGYARVLIDSYTKHRLQGDDRIAYNARVFAYRAAFPLVLDTLHGMGADSEAVRGTRRLADIGPDRFSLPNIYRALAALPDRMCVAEAGRRFHQAVDRLGAVGVPPPLAGFDDLLQTYFADGVQPECLSLKGVALYGLAECWRSRLYADLIERGDLDLAGRLVYRGHDGDRVARRDSSGHYVPDAHPVTSALLEALACQAECGDPERREAAGLEWQAGDYEASVPELDRIVDLCRESGAISASLTGAGLGGVVTAMIERERLPDLHERLFDLYEDEERAEIRRLEEASASGAVAPEVLSAARATRKAKLETRGDDFPYRPEPEWRDALEGAASLRTEQGDLVLRLVPVDYYRRGLSLNRSIAGAGYLTPPAP